MTSDHKVPPVPTDQLAWPVPQDQWDLPDPQGRKELRDLLDLKELLAPMVRPVLLVQSAPLERQERRVQPVLPGRRAPSALPVQSVLRDLRVLPDLLVLLDREVR